MIQGEREIKTGESSQVSPEAARAARRLYRDLEFSLGWWLAQAIPWHLALAVVALNRLLWTLNDFLYVGLGLALVRLRRRD